MGVPSADCGGKSLKVSVLQAKFIVADVWLSEMLGKKAYRLSLDEENRLSLNLTEIPAPSFVTAKIAADKPADLELLQRAGFKIIETSVLYDKAISKEPLTRQAILTRFAAAEDEEAAVALGASCIEYSRFHCDPKIDKTTANKLKGEWVRNYFSGTRGDQMVLAVSEEKIVGFLQLIKKDKALIIDLIAVERSFRGKGAASAMIRFAEVSNPGFERIQAGTQEANVASTALYEKLGFKRISSELVFHKHQ